MKVNRRTFIKLSAIGAGSLIGPNIINAQENPNLFPGRWQWDCIDGAEALGLPQAADHTFGPLVDLTFGIFPIDTDPPILIMIPYTDSDTLASQPPSADEVLAIKSAFERARSILPDGYTPPLLSKFRSVDPPGMSLSGIAVVWQQIPPSDAEAYVTGACLPDDTRIDTTSSLNPPLSKFIVIQIDEDLVSRVGPKWIEYLVFHELLHVLLYMPSTYKSSAVAYIPSANESIVTFTTLIFNAQILNDLPEGQKIFFQGLLKQNQARFFHSAEFGLNNFLAPVRLDEGVGDYPNFLFWEALNKILAIIYPQLGQEERVQEIWEFYTVMLSKLIEMALEFDRLSITEPSHISEKLNLCIEAVMRDYFGIDFRQIKAMMAAILLDPNHWVQRLSKDKFPKIVRIPEPTQPYNMLGREILEDAEVIVSFSASTDGILSVNKINFAQDSEVFAYVLIVPAGGVPSIYSLAGS